MVWWFVCLFVSDIRIKSGRVLYQTHAANEQTNKQTNKMADRKSREPSPSPSASAAVSVAVPKEAEQDDNPWMRMTFDEVVGELAVISKELDRAELGKLYQSGFSAQVKKLLRWTFANHTELLSHRSGDGRFFDKTGRLFDTRFRALDLIMQALCQLTLMDSATGPGLYELAKLGEHACIGQGTKEDVLRAMSFRLRLALLTFNHRWKVPLNYDLIQVAARKTFQDVFAFEMDEERQKREIEADPMLKAKLADDASKPAPYFYFSGKFTDHELKHNPALPAVFGIADAEFDAMCCYRLVEARRSKAPVSDATRDLCRLAAWQIFQNEFYAYLLELYDKGGCKVESLEGIKETRVLTEGIHLFEEYVGTEVNYERDASVRAFCSGVLFRLTSPFGFEEIYRADHKSNIDRFDPKLQYICNQWLEPSGRLYDGWLANLSEIAGMTVDAALLRLGAEQTNGTDGWDYQAFFYEQFNICMLYHCDSVSMDRYTIFPSEALRRYPELAQRTVSSFPPVEKRPMVLCLGTRFFLCVRQKFYECDSLAHACVSWVVVVMRLFEGQLEDRHTSVEPLYNLLVSASRRREIANRQTTTTTRKAAAEEEPVRSSAIDKTRPPLRMDIF